ncbi:MAG: isoprenylcysteine carboxylmethyltransferase family protein [Chloroflexi bacterium]|nr:isoprenylcysteine carboxylmethyltransferase family protein [Chloroflexota bacterium]
MRIAKHIRAIVLLPIMATIVIPGVILLLTRPVSPGWALSPPLSLIPLVLGLALVCLGLLLMVETVRLFAVVGEGTLAPWDPTRTLVVRGVYRHVRNPMISGVFCILLGEAALLRSVFLLGWFLLFLLSNLIYIPLVEEPGLEQRFGQDYQRYRENVARWLPRLRPWDAALDSETEGER